MSDYSLKLSIGDITVEATATTDDNIQRLFEYAVDKIPEVRKRNESV
jgi:hypothetical protein